MINEYAEAARLVANGNADNPRLLDFRNELHRAANEMDRQAARIAELGGALRALLKAVHDEADSIDEDGGVCVYCFGADIEDARRVLGGAK